MDFVGIGSVYWGLRERLEREMHLHAQREVIDQCAGRNFFRVDDRTNAVVSFIDAELADGQG